MKDKRFSTLREFLWPIERAELKQVLPMVVMMFFFLFNYTIMRDTKDILVLTAAGAEVIPFLKFWGTLPLSIVFVLVYAKLSNRLHEETLFYVTVAPFLLFFSLFGFLFYPFREWLQPTAAAVQLQFWAELYLPVGMQQTALLLVELFRNWIFALFYILSELWGSMGISLLFWQFANGITTSSDAKRFYPRYTQLGNLALIVSGMMIVYFSGLKVSADAAAWGVMIKWLMGAVTVGCLAIILSYRYMQRQVVSGKENKASVKERPKLTLKETFLYLSKSKYLGAIALLVLGYGMAINLVEVVYKSQLKLQFPNECDLSRFLGYQSIATGMATLLLVTFSGYLIRHVGWFAAALATPILLLTTGGIFFSFVFFGEELKSWIPFSPLWIALIAGCSQNVISKAAKYSLFDPTKEMAYIPLDAESKVKGKAAVDVVGGRLGKSCGGLFLQVVLLFGTILQHLSLLFLMVGSVITLWIGGVVYLQRERNRLVSPVSTTI